MKLFPIPLSLALAASATLAHNIPPQTDAERAEMQRRLCTWPVSRLADLPEFRIWGESRSARRVRAAIEKENGCDRPEVKVVPTTLGRKS